MQAAFAFKFYKIKKNKPFACDELDKFSASLGSWPDNTGAPSTSTLLLFTVIKTVLLESRRKHCGEMSSVIFTKLSFVSKEIKFKKVCKQRHNDLQ